MIALSMGHPSLNVCGNKGKSKTYDSSGHRLSRLSYPWQGDGGVPDLEQLPGRCASSRRTWTPGTYPPRGRPRRACSPPGDPLSPPGSNARSAPLVRHYLVRFSDCDGRVMENSCVGCWQVSFCVYLCICGREGGGGVGPHSILRSPFRSY